MSDSVPVLFNGLQADNMSGTGRHTYELAKGLAALAPAGEIFFLWPDSLEFPAAPGFPTDCILRVSAPRAFMKPWYDQMVVPKLAKRLGVRVTHYPANVGRMFGRTPMIQTIHDLSYFRNPPWFSGLRAYYYQIGTRLSARRANRIIALSNTTAHDIRHILDFPLNRIDVIPNGISPHFAPAPPEAVTRVRERYRLPARFFLYVGTLEPRKNVPRLIEAWNRSLASTDLDLVIAGRTGWKTHAIGAAIKRVSSPNRLHFPGYIADDDLPALLSAAHAFVWPSLWEGFGIPPLEAMACGTPVLTSNVSCLPEIMGDAAVLVNPADADEIANGLVLVALDEDLRQSLAERGKGRSSLYTWDNVARLTLACYRKAAEG